MVDMNNATHFGDRSHLDAFHTNCVTIWDARHAGGGVAVVTNECWTDEPKSVRPKSVAFANINEARSALKSAGFTLEPRYCEWVR